MVGDPEAVLTRHGRAFESVFDLLGRRENDLTAALGYTLARSPSLLQRLVREVGLNGGAANVLVHLKTAGNAGRTDLELDTGKSLAIVEAKRGWHLSQQAQLEHYASRVRQRDTGVLVTLSDCSAAFAAHTLPTHVL